MNQDTNADEVKVVENVDALVKAIENIMGNEEINSVNVLSLCINAMQIVEKMPKMSGEMKKKVVVSAIGELISRRKGDMSLLSLIPQFIDTTINVEKGKIHITINPEEVLSCCASMCGSFANVKN